MKFSESLKKNEQFREVYKKGKSLANKYLVVYVLENNQERNYLGISVSKKVGNSVKRNRARRLMKESYRHLLAEGFIPDGPQHYDFIMIARNTISGRKCAEVEKSLRSAFRRTGIKKK